MSDISKLPARQVDQSHDTLAGLAREVLDYYADMSIGDLKEIEIDAIALARAVLEQQGELDAQRKVIGMKWDEVPASRILADLHLVVGQTGRDIRDVIKEQQAENKRLREEIKKLLRLAELDYQRAFDGLSSGQYIIALDSVLGIAESAKTVAQRALASEQP